MPTNHRFTQPFADSIVATLECHDRVIFKGYLPFGGDEHGRISCEMLPNCGPIGGWWFHREFVRVGR